MQLSELIKKDPVIERVAKALRSCPALVPARNS